MQNKKIIYIVGGFLFILIGGGLVFFFGRKTGLIKTPPKTVTDSVTMPKIDKITGTEGMFVSKGESVPMPLVPKSSEERVVVTDAVLTAKGSFDLAQKSALAWAPDAKLVFIKTLGTVMLDGRTSYWQIGFGSLKKKSGYEIVIKGGAIVSATEVPATAYGYDLPKNWYDSSDAISSIRTLPQFDAATLSQVNFFYDIDAQEWRYSIVSSIGASVIRVR